jgi:predicted GIY-YIG superfamily endonuclease
MIWYLLRRPTLVVVPIFRSSVCVSFGVVIFFKFGLCFGLLLARNFMQKRKMMKFKRNSKTRGFQRYGQSNKRHRCSSSDEDDEDDPDDTDRNNNRMSQDSRALSADDDDIMIQRNEDVDTPLICGRDKDSCWRCTRSQDKKATPDCKNTDRNNNTMSEDSEALSADDDDTMSKRNDDDILLECLNCCRQASPFPCDVMEYNFDISMVDRSDVTKNIRRLKFCNLSRTLDSEFPLCQLCRMYLGVDDYRGVRHNDWSSVWPAFLWKMLTTYSLIQEHGVFLWQLVPQDWRIWWIDAIQDMHQYKEITLFLPESIIEEVSVRRRSIQTKPKDLRLGEMMKTMDAYNKPTVKCPWGCTEFPHKGAGLNLDVVLLRYLGSSLCCFTPSSTRLVKRVNSARDDFFLYHDYLLFNRKWKISASIFYDGCFGPRLMTCSNHGGGDKNSYFHPCRHPSSALSASDSDQLSPVVLRSRTIKRMKASTYSTGYQMNRMKGAFDGVDTLWMTDSHRFDKCSWISGEKEEAALNHRPDINAMVTNWSKEENIASKEELCDMLENANGSANLQEDDMKLVGGTYMTVADALNVQKLVKLESGATVLVRDSNNEHKSVYFKGSWPRLLVSVHPLNKYGARFPIVPTLFDSKTKQDLRLLWVVTGLIVCIPVLWEDTVRSLQSTDQWNGWMLRFASDKCLINRTMSSSKDDPFRDISNSNFVGLTSKLRSKNQSSTDYDYGGEMQQLFNLHSGVHVADGPFDKAIVPENINLILGYQRLATRVLDERVILADGSEFELRFLCYTQSSVGDILNHKWKGVMYCRHGGVFCGWQRLKREGRLNHTFSYCPSFNLGSQDEWDICVYVRVEKMSVKYVRDEFIQTLGGQTTAFCGEHDLPLVICCLGTEGRQCSHLECSIQHNKQLHYRCPIKECGTTLCSTHQKNVQENQKYFYPRNDAELSDTNFFDARSTVSIEETNDVVIGSVEYLDDDISHLEINHVDDVDNDDNSLDDSDFDHEDNQLSEHRREDDYYFDALEDLCQDFVTDGGLVDGTEIYEAIEEEMHDEKIPTTSSGAGAATMLSTSVSGCVILNNCGSLLARKRSKTIGSINSRSFLHRITAVNAGKSVPLLYPEGMLFPSVFWHGTDNDWAVTGAIPAGLMTAGPILSELGIANIVDHMRCRLTSSQLGTSTDPRYNFYAFDCMANLGVRDSDTRIVLNRGFATKQGSGGVKAAGSGDALFDTDSIDSRKVVNKLASAVAQRQATYFFTHTCNQQDHFGVREIKRWLESLELEDALLELMPPGKHSFERMQELKISVKEGSAVTMLRCWMETVDKYMKYIAYSDERPIGKVDKIWYRHEYQDAAGNLSHIHALVWISTKESRAESMDRIRGSIRDLIREDEIDQLVSEGILSTPRSVNEIKEAGRHILKHSCSDRCKRRTGVGKDETVCRTASSICENPNWCEHSLKELHVCHDQEAAGVLRDIDLLVPDNDGCCFKINDLSKDAECLRAVKHFPPINPVEGVISPCNGRLFAATLSSQNLQLCTGYLASRYLAKYAAGIDENRVHIGAMQDNREGFQAKGEFVCNTKVTGSAIMESERAAGQQNALTNAKGRAMSQMEIIALMLGYEQVFTNISFVHVSTIPLEERPGREKKTQLSYLKKQEEVPRDQSRTIPRDLDCQVIPSHYARQKIRRLQSWRRHTASELLLLRDQVLSPLTMDSGTRFGIRPPELRFIRHQKEYFQFFEVDTNSGRVTAAAARQRFEIEVVADFLKSAWIDGFNCYVRLRYGALPRLLEYMETLSDDDFECDLIDRSARTIRVKFFEELYQLACQQIRHTASQATVWNSRKQIYLVGDASEELPVIWFNSVRPGNSARFLYHLLLSMGKFDNEVNLLSGISSMRTVFKNCGLVESFDEFNVKRLVEKYVIQQLVYLPGGSKQFDRCCVECFRCISSSILRDEICIDDLPPVLFTALNRKADEEANDAICTNRESLVDSMLASLGGIPSIHNLPTKSSLLSATLSDPISTSISVSRNSSQSEASFIEQFAALSMAEKAFDSYIGASTNTVKNVCFTGGPGNGKSFCAKLATVMGLAKGLNLMSTSLMSENSLSLGGIHIHKWSALPPCRNVSVVRLAELALIKLFRKPKLIKFLCALDGIFLDELGQVSCEMLSVLDIILRRIRNRKDFMGGLLIIATMDPLQLLPVNGRPPILSPHLLTSFHLINLNESVRASNDRNLREIQQITRLLPSQLIPPVLRRFKTLIKNDCTFVRSWSDESIPRAALRVFGRREAVRRNEALLLSSIRSDASLLQLCCNARDEESTPEGHWQTASEPTSRRLSRMTKEPSELLIYPGALYELTFNKEGHFSQSQLAMMCEEMMPTQEAVSSFTPLCVMLAPEGCKSSPLTMSIKELTALGWRLVHVGVAPEHHQTIRRGGLQGKRHQYGLRHRIGSTIHACMGQTLDALVTSVSTHIDMYKLWEREQVVVLLSRTRKAADLIFVGDKDDTADALVKVLSQRSHFTDYICHILERFSGQDCPVIDITHYPFRPIDVDLPHDNTGFVYLLVSLRDSQSTYIGQTLNLFARLHQHNSGIGSLQTSPATFRPWALYGFVCCFDNDRRAMLDFEKEWQMARDRIPGIRSPEQIFSTCSYVIDNFNEERQQPFALRLVRCGIIPSN